MQTLVKSLTAALVLAAPLVAAPALAAPDACCAPEARVSNWVAPLDNYPYQQVRLFGLVPAPANEGVLDRALRLVAGAGLIGLAATDPWQGGTAVRAGAGAVGAVMLWTSVTGACPAYMPFGLSTRERPAD